MIFHVLACDYDGTLALRGRVDKETAEALESVKRSGRKLMMVTGRELPDLRKVCEYLDLFDVIVAENGGLLYLPGTREERLLCEAANEELVKELERRGVAPLSVGKGIIATWEPHQQTTLDAIQSLGLEYSVIFNKGAVMLLPTNVNKGSGLEAGLLEISYSRHNTVGMGDAENDHIFLSKCECGVAVANALPALKGRADFVTEKDHGAGVKEFIDRYLLSDCVDLTEHLFKRHRIVLGESLDGQEIAIPAQRSSLLVTGGSGSGKSTLTGVLIERLIEDERTVCVIDPEGDYAPLAEIDTVIVMGGANDKPLPSPDELAQLVTMPKANLVLNLHALTLAEKTDYVATVLGTLKRIHAEKGKPNWLVIDEAHHVLPSEESIVSDVLPTADEGLCLITYDAALMAPTALQMVKSIATRSNKELGGAVEAVLKARGMDNRQIDFLDPDKLPSIEEDQAVIVELKDDQPINAIYFHVSKRRTTHQRHSRKYATGELPEERSFYFRGPEGKLNLRAANLLRFGELAQGIDDDTWLYHLKRGDYSEWMRRMIKNRELADEVAEIENGKNGNQNLTPEGSRRAVLDAINKRYTA
jgi:HAD superfamily hydrolase (TIGR01484 family)